MNTRKLELWILLADIAWIVLAFFVADWIRFGLTWSLDERIAIRALLPFLGATCLTWTVLSIFMAMDGFRGGWRLSAVVSQLLFGIGCILTVLVGAGYFARSYVSRLALTYFIVLLGAGFVGVRCGARTLLRLRHEEGDVWRVVIVGSGRVAQEVAAKIEQHPEMLCKVVGMLFPNQSAEELAASVPQQRKSQLSTLGIFDLLRDARVDEIIVALEHPLTPEIRTMISRARDMGIQASLVPQSYELYASKPRLISLDGLPLLQLHEPSLRRHYVALKSTLDFVGAMVLSVPASLLLAPMAAILFFKKGAGFRWESRSGQYGIPFSMLRLNVERPVVNNSRFELLLEHLSITELPQLLNVLRGQMSLVGPRPESPVRSSQYSEWQQRRLRVKPGMTGLAQVHGLREDSSSEQKTRFDLQYVMQPYLLWDISLLLQTIWTLILRMASPRPRRKLANVDLVTLDLERPGQAAPNFVANAHRTQSSAD